MTRTGSTLKPRKAVRPTIALAAAAAAAGALIAGCTAGAPTATGTHHGWVSGLPLKDPPDLTAAPGSDAKLRLVAAPTRFDLSGRSVSGASYNGSFVGPTVHLAPGEHVQLTLVDHLATPTDLHFHGMHLSPSGSADDVSLSVAPGHSFPYELDIPADQPQGTFWYHDHDMCMGPATVPCADVESQVFAGLAGTIVVGDDRSLLPSGLRAITAHTLVFKDVQVDATGHILQDTPTGATINSDAPAVRLVNGELQPVLTMRPGEVQLWRLANEGANIFYDLALEGGRFTVIGEDGYPVAQVTTATTLVLPPGKRYDVLVTAPSLGQAWLRTLSYTNGPQGDWYPDTPLMQVRVAGPPEAAVPMPTGSLPTAPPDLANAPIAQHRTVTLSEDSTGTQMYINGKQFDMANSVFSTPAALGTVEEWTITNTSGEVHPFHIHTEHFQVMSVDGAPKPFTGWQDTVPVPYEQNGVPGRVVIRIAFTDFTGKVMFHCHIAAHEDSGMMSYIDVVDPGGGGAAVAPANSKAGGVGGMTMGMGG